MTPRQALNLLDQVAARFQGSREDHVNLQNALSTLNQLVEETQKTNPTEEVEDQPED